VKISFSSLKASYEMRYELLDHQRSFFKESVDLYANSPEKAYIFGANSDPSTLSSFLDVLLRHRIEVYTLKTSIALGGNSFTPEDSYIIPLNQPRYRLIQSLFKPLTSFEDSLFYDISAWTLPYAFNIPCHALTSSKTVTAQTGDQVSGLSGPAGKLDGEISSVGYLFHWNDYQASRVLYKIQQAGLLTQVASQPIGYKNQQINKTFSYGSIFIPVEKQDRTAAEIHEILKDAVQNTNVTIYPLSTSYTVAGMDMGSNLLIPLKNPRILLLTGDGIRSLDAGEIWHLLDVRMNIPVALIDMGQLNSMDLSPYTHLILPPGSYDKISSPGKEEIGRWLKRGGCIIALNSANQWLAKNSLADLEFRQMKKDTSGHKPYHEYFPARGAQRISGTIFEAEIDISHPIGYGLNRRLIPVYRTSTLIPKQVHRPYAVPLRYTDDPLLSGYVPKGKLDDLRNIPGIIISSRGEGRIISFVDNPNFRGFWYGTNKLFMNAIFFGPTISAGSTR
jgi:hypothetical protein